MNKILNISQSTGRRVSAMVLVLVASLLGAGSAMAAYWSGFFKNNAQNMYFSYQVPLSNDWHKTWMCDGGCNSTGVGTYAIGPVSSLYIDDFNAITWKTIKKDSDTQWGNVCSVTLYYTIDNWSTTKNWNCSVTSSSTAGETTNQTWGMKKGDQGGINLLSLAGNTPGDYTLKFNYSGSFKRNEDTKNCPDENTTLKLDNGMQDYQVTFTIPGFSGGSSSINVGNVQKGGTKTALLESEYIHYGTALTTNNCQITGTNADMFSVTAISETDVTVSFTAPQGEALGEKKATLTIKDAHGKTKEISLSATVISVDKPVVLIADTAHISIGPSVVLQGYLKKTGCVDNISKYGFKYAATCAEVENGTDVSSTVTSPMKQGALFSKTIKSGLEESTTYYYRPYVYSETNGYVYSDDCGTFITRKKCTYADTDTIYYTIDASVAENDDCALVYKTFEDALADLKTHTDWWNSEILLLNKHVVFKVAPGSYGTPDDWIDFSNINKYSSSKPSTPTKYFIIRSLTPNTNPIVYGMNLANSRWVTVDGMNIKRDNTNKGLNYSAILVGRNSESNDLQVGLMEDARIKFVNCQIEGQNFSSIHANGIDGFYMENCKLVAAGDASTGDDTFNWGASIKFMNSKNIVLLRNDFKGAHANNIFAQNVRNMLVMNNVFWNDNAVKRPNNNSNYKSIIRLINFKAGDDAHKVQNVGIYYNTMYIADNDKDGFDEALNFLTLGGKYEEQSKDLTKYNMETIDFMYNNCYSYDTGITGRPTGEYDAFSGTDVSESTHLAHNNFWSQYDSDQKLSKSGFAFGSDAKFINVRGQVCSTAPNTPEGLVIRGEDLNLGSKITADVAKATYATKSIDATQISDDRLRFKIRPSEGDKKWTLGAYQQIAGQTVDEIIWNGAENNSWDNRNNWVKPNGQLVTCTDQLSDNLKVIIPAPNSKRYPLPAAGSIDKYPQIEEWDNNNIPDEGVRVGSPKNKYASKIELEYGAALLGTENLGTERYKEATAYLEAGRSEWILVGNMVNPFTSDAKTETRNIKSRDYFIANHEPHVYMQHVVQDGTDVKNGVTFTSLETTVSNQSTYMIRIPDQYGPYKLPADIYYSYYKKDQTMVNDKSVPKTFTFNGRFASQTGFPQYTDLNNDGSTFNFVSNYYTANLDINKLRNDNSGWSAKYYDYERKSWRSVVVGGIYIKPQSGFILVGTGKPTIETNSSHYVSGNTAYKRADATDMVEVSLTNTFDGSSSVIYVMNDGSRATKAFGMNESTPELYMIDSEDKLDVLSIVEDGQRIPLGIRNSSGRLFTVQFKLESVNGFDNIILEDAKNNTTYNLAEEQPIFDALATGDIVGRFFLNVGYTEDNPVTEVDETSGDVDNSSISIFAQRDQLIVASSTNSKIEKIVVSDMSGRNWSFAPNGTNYSVHTLHVENGIYTVTVITDKATKNQKIIIKR